MNIFYSRPTIRWVLISNTLAGVTAFWTIVWLGLWVIVPDRYPRYEVVFVGTISCFLGLLMKSGRPSVAEIISEVETAKALVEGTSRKRPRRLGS